MKINDPEQVEIGDWVTMCCELDLFQIGTNEELADVREQISIWSDDEEGVHYERWDSEVDALKEIRKRYRPGRYYNDGAIAAIDDRIAKIAG